MSAFVEVAPLLAPATPEASQMRSLLLHLYDSAHVVDLGFLLAATAPVYRAAALAVLQAFAQRGHADPDFVALVHRLKFETDVNPSHPVG